MRDDKAEHALWRRMLRSALLSNLVCGAAISGLLMLAAGAEAVSLKGVDGEQGMLTVTGELVDSPCRLSMDSRDQTVDLGTLASADLRYPGARSQPVTVAVRLEGCLPAAGSLYDERTGAVTLSNSQPVVEVAFTAPADLSDPSLMKLTGVEGIALRMTDDHNRDIRLGSRGIPQQLSPGDNTLRWSIIAERVPGPLRPGAFRAVTDFRLSYE
ncbi:type 1 fimbrial protein [Enterobacter cloacae]|nr:type 1 fimbrial protein [Enterobacter cloacae]